MNHHLLEVNPARIVQLSTKKSQKKAANKTSEKTFSESENASQWNMLEQTSVSCSSYDENDEKKEYISNYSTVHNQQTLQRLHTKYHQK